MPATAAPAARSGRSRRRPARVWQSPHAGRPRTLGAPAHGMRRAALHAPRHQFHGRDGLANVGEGERDDLLDRRCKLAAARKRGGRTGRESRWDSAPSGTGAGVAGGNAGAHARGSHPTAAALPGESAVGVISREGPVARARAAWRVGALDVRGWWFRTGRGDGGVWYAGRRLDHARPCQVDRGPCQRRRLQPEPVEHRGALKHRRGGAPGGCWPWYDSWIWGRAPFSTSDLY